MHDYFVIDDKMKNDRVYDGVTKKVGITVEGEDFIVKYPENGFLSQVYSEVVASRFINAIGFKAHKTFIGLYGEDTVMILRDFSNDGLRLKQYMATSQGSVDTDLRGKQYTYDDVLHIIDEHKTLADKDQVIDDFWDMFTIDAILGNRDRHKGNWGFVYPSHESTCYFSPLFDNGGCLFPDVDKMHSSLLDLSPDFIKERSSFFPASKFCVDGPNGVKKTNYREIFQRVGSTRLSRSIDAKSVLEAINIAVEICEPEYKRFYILLVLTRYFHIICGEELDVAYERASAFACG